jgi:hypothetical protein
VADEIGEPIHVKFLTVTFHRIVLVSENSKYFDGGLAGMFDLKEGVRVLNSSLASLTKIKVVANSAFVSGSLNIVLLTVITSITFVNYLRRFNFFRLFLLRFLLLRLGKS